MGQQSPVFGRFSFFLFLLTITWPGRLAEIRWSVSISKSLRSLCVSFSRTDSIICTVNFFFLHDSQWINFPTQTYLLLLSYILLIPLKGLHILVSPDIGLGVRVFANGPGDLGSIPGRVIPKTQKMVLDASLLSTQHYKVRIKGKVEQSRKGVASSPTHWCCSYRKGSLRVTLDYGRQLFICLNFQYQ